MFTVRYGQTKDGTMENVPNCDSYIPVQLLCNCGMQFCELINRNIRLSDFKASK
jgi:hypothetical protein